VSVRNASLPFAGYAPTASGELPQNLRDGLVSTAEVQADVLELFDRAAPSLRRYVRSCGIAPDAAEDVVQEAFLALFRHLCGGGARQNLHGWLMQVSYRLALRHRERRTRMQRHESPWEPGIADGVADPAEDPEAQMAMREHQGRLQAVFRALPERERQCLSLRAEGVRYREIAQLLGISLGTVAKSLTYAITRLSNAVKG
jgi:RNA polymerase sigma-70 factor (ECF subfamily)